MEVLTHGMSLRMLLLCTEDIEVVLAVVTILQCIYDVIKEQSKD